MNYVILFFIILMLLAGWLNQRSRALTYGLIILYFILICFSYDNYDYINYTHWYEVISGGGTIHYEPLFELFFRIGGSLGLNYFQFRIVSTIIQLHLIQSTVKRYCGNNAFVWSMFIVFPGWILTTLFRFFFGMSVIVFGLRFLIEDSFEEGHIRMHRRNALVRLFRDHNWIKYVICVIIASLIHSSLWIMLVLVAVKFIKTKWLIIISIAMTLIFGLFMESNLVKFLSTLFYLNEGYKDTIELGIKRSTNGMLFSALRQGLIFGFGWLSVKLYRFGRSDDPKCKLEDTYMSMVLPVNSAAIMFLIIAFFSSNTRLSHIIVLFNLIAYGISINSRRKRTLQTALLKFAALGEGLLLSWIMCTRESETAFDLVLKMLFETNDFINLLN